MTLLSEQINEVKIQLELITAGDENRVAIAAYEKFLNQFLPIVGKLEDNSQKKNILKNIPQLFLDSYTQEQADLNTCLNSATASLNALKLKWQQDDYKVVQDDSFDNTVQAISSLLEKILEQNKALWQEWCEHLSTSFNITEAELKSIEHVNKYQIIRDAFLKERKNFQRLSKYERLEEGSIENLKKLSFQLENLIKDIDFDIPEEVKLFFESLNDFTHKNKAPLSLLTSEVLKWIKDNNETASFSIMRT